MTSIRHVSCRGVQAGRTWSSTTVLTLYRFDAAGNATRLGEITGSSYRGYGVRFAFG